MIKQFRDRDTIAGLGKNAQLKKSSKEPNDNNYLVRGRKKFMF